ncbi:hypothetical protein EJB05_20857, partial [Eragrostis curvula]
MWPPDESTRECHVDQLASNMSNQTYAGRVYGVLGKEDAYENAERIERACFDKGEEHFKEHGGDGRSALRLYAKEACKMVTEVMERAPRTAKKVRHAWLQDTIEILNKMRQVPTGAAKHGPDRKRAFNHEPDEAEDLASSSLTNSRSSCKKICFKDMSFGIGDANVDAGSDLKLDVSTNTHMKVGARCSTQWIMERLEYVLTNINGNFISDEGVDGVKKILEAVRSTNEKESDGEAEDDNEGRTTMMGWPQRCKTLKVDH